MRLIPYFVNLLGGGEAGEAGEAASEDKRERELERGREAKSYDTMVVAVV